MEKQAAKRCATPLPLPEGRGFGCGSVKEKLFLVEGEIVEKGKKKHFSKKIEAKTASFAAEKALCLFGSKNKVKRNKIFLHETKEVEEDAGKEKGD